MTSYPLSRTESQVVHWAGRFIAVAGFATIALLGTVALAFG